MGENMMGSNTGDFSIAVSAQNNSLRELSSSIDECSLAFARLAESIIDLAQPKVFSIVVNIGGSEGVVECRYCGKSEFKPGLYGFTVCCSCGAPQGEVVVNG